MHLKGDLLSTSKTFTGFVVHNIDGISILEKENYFSKKLNKKCSTNWAEIDKSKVSAVELHWKGECMARIDRSPSDAHKNELTAKDWFFSHHGYLDMSIVGKINIISRNIGFIEGSILHIISVLESNGEVIRSIRGI